MDSMRSLNTSLPSTRPAPPEALLQAFRTAALSVTNLYKSAVTDQNASRQAGYQEALADILSFLDKENLGLQDGEGWRVRQWATERYDGSELPQQSESDDESSEPGQRPRSMTPSREPPLTAPSDPSGAPRTEATPQAEETARPTAQDQPTVTPIFYFTGNTAPQACDDMQTDGECAVYAENSGSPAPMNTNRSGNAKPRGSRTPLRSGNAYYSTRSATKDLPVFTGTKRKVQIPDFFDISNIGPREGPGSNKRGRIS